MSAQTIGIIGSGIAGLSAAWFLGKRHKVTLFEAHQAPGMGAFNLDVEVNGNNVRVDLPLRAFNACYYKNLMKLYQALGVEVEKTDHAAAYAHPDLSKAFFDYRYVNLGKFAIPMIRNLKHLNRQSLTLFKDMTKFLVVAKNDWQKGKVTGVTIGDYLRKSGYSKAFINDILMPSFAGIGTCSYDAVEHYPAEIIIEFLASGMLFNGIWRAKKGADDAINRMVEACDQVICNSRTERIERRDGKLHITQADGSTHRFDHVIVATQANQAAPLLQDVDPELSRLLARVPYEASELMVHRDTRLLPKGWEHQAPVSFLVDPDHDKPMASICLNKIYPQLRDAEPIFQTWNPIREPRADAVLKRAWFERPTPTLNSLRAIQTLQHLQKQAKRQIWCVGSYAMPGIPLLESAVQSSLQVSEQLGCSPFEQIDGILHRDILSPIIKTPYETAT